MFSKKHSSKVNSEDVFAKQTNKRTNKQKPEVNVLKHAHIKYQR